MLFSVFSVKNAPLRPSSRLEQFLAAAEPALKVRPDALGLRAQEALRFATGEFDEVSITFQISVTQQRHP